MFIKLSDLENLLVLNVNELRGLKNIKLHLLYYYLHIKSKIFISYDK